MKIRLARSTDCDALASLVRSFEAVLVLEPSAAEPFWSSMTAEAHKQNLTSSRYIYLVAELEDEDNVVGYVAMRDRTHLFNLFVAEKYQRRGVGRQLWKTVCRKLPAASEAPVVTVNASLNAVPAYTRMGFVPAGPETRVHGIGFLPMQLNRLENAA